MVAVGIMQLVAILNNFKHNLLEIWQGFFESVFSGRMPVIDRWSFIIN